MDEFLTPPSDSAARAIDALPAWSIPDILSFADSATLSNQLPLVKAQSAGEIFSTGSSVNPNIAAKISDSVSSIELHSQSWQISLFLLIVLGYYIYVVYRYRHILPSIFRVAPSVNKTLMVYESQNNEQTGLGFHGLVLLILSLATTFIEFSQKIVNLNPVTSILIIITSVVIVFLYKFFIVNICTLFSAERSDFHNIKSINSHSGTLLSIIFTPIAIAATTSHQANILIIIILFTLWAFYSLRLLATFIKSGFGKLQWFLYLCTVEILPVSFILALAVRY